jgi:hypothetical protein
VKVPIESSGRGGEATCKLSINFGLFHCASLLRCRLTGTSIQHSSVSANMQLRFQSREFDFRDSAVSSSSLIRTGLSGFDSRRFYIGTCLSHFRASRGVDNVSRAVCALPAVTAQK